MWLSKKIQSSLGSQVTITSSIIQLAILNYCLIQNHPNFPGAARENDIARLRFRTRKILHVIEDQKIKTGYLHLPTVTERP